MEVVKERDETEFETIQKKKKDSKILEAIGGLFAFIIIIAALIYIVGIVRGNDNPLFTFTNCNASERDKICDRYCPKYECPDCNECEGYCFEGMEEINITETGGNLLLYQKCLENCDKKYSHQSSSSVRTCYSACEKILEYGGK